MKALSIELQKYCEQYTFHVLQRRNFIRKTKPINRLAPPCFILLTPFWAFIVIGYMGPIQVQQTENIPL